MAYSIKPADQHKVKLDIEITSTSHMNYTLDFPSKQLQITTIKDGKDKYFLKTGEITISPAVEIDSWKYADSFLAALSITDDGVFSRVVWERQGALQGIHFCLPKPSTIDGVGVSVHSVNPLDLSKEAQYLAAFDRIYERVNSDEKAFAILTFYSVSNWFLNAGLIREAAINYFSVVEAIATITIPDFRGKTVYEMKDILKAMSYLKIDSSVEPAVRQAYGIRGDISHGNAKYLTIIQHSLGANPTSSASLREPALACKAAADIFLKRYFGI